jgi:hypothetical protein
VGLKQRQKVQNILIRNHILYMLFSTPKSLRGVMQRTVIALVTLVGLSYPAVADEWDKILFFAATNDADARTLNTETGETQRLLAGIEGQPPEECPSQAYWAPMDKAPIDTIISCANGEKFALVRGLYVAQGTRVLKPVSGP